MNRRQVWRVSRVLIGSLALVTGMHLYAQEPGAGAAIQVGTFTTFDAPGAGTASYQGTSPYAINGAAVIVGSYSNSSGSYGFVRSPGGSFVTLYAPDGSGVTPFAINESGVIAGYYGDVYGTHGFLRATDGVMTTFDPPGSIYTQPNGINAAGMIVGTYYDTNYAIHGFVRATNGNITTIDVPGAGTGSFAGTFASGINGSGTISGCYGTFNVGHGFLRTSDGTITSFDPPGSSDTCFPPLNNLNYAGSHINEAGEIAGTYSLPTAGNPFGEEVRGYLRASDGTITGFDAATYPPCCIFTYVLAINRAGLIAGTQNDGYSINHGYLRLRNGTILTLDAPGAGLGFNQGTVAFAINTGGQVTGWYLDSNNVYHGFLWNR
jgi:hypothetical protein